MEFTENLPNTWVCRVGKGKFYTILKKSIKGKAYYKIYRNLSPIGFAISLKKATELASKDQTARVVELVDTGDLKSPANA